MTNITSISIKDSYAQTNGHGRMHYLEAGSGETVILIHTNGGSVHQYKESMTSLAQNYRVIAWDMPGHGDSDPLIRHYSIEDYCAALAAFMDALEIPVAHISGCSCGGTISVGFAGLYHHRTLSTAIVETPFRTDDEWGARWDHVEGNFGIPTQSAEEVGHRLSNATEALVTRWNIDRNKAGGKLMVSVMWAMRQFDVNAGILNIRRPAMILYGAKGPTIAMRDRPEKSVPQITITVLPASGHFPMLDEPLAFANTLGQFFKRATA